MTPTRLTHFGLTAVLLGILAAAMLGRLANLVPEFDWFAHFPATYLLLALAGTLVLALRRQWPAASLGVLVILVCGGLYLAPFTGTDRGQRTDLTVACLNVLVRNQHLDDVIESLPEADVLILLETSRQWTSRLETLRARWPEQWVQLRDTPFGLAVLSRVPVEQVDWFLLAPQQNPALQIDLLVDGLPVTVAAIHAMSPQSPRLLAVRDAQFQLLEQRFVDGPENLIIVGDFNATPWSAVLRRLSDVLGLRPTDTGRGPLGSAAGTWPAWLPGVIRIPIDHCLIRGDLETVDLEVVPIPGSDHLGLSVALQVGG